MRNRGENFTKSGILFLILVFFPSLLAILGANALDVTYTSTTTFTTSITHVSTREVYETITRTQTSTWDSIVTVTFTTEGSAPEVEILSQLWTSPVLSLVLYNKGGPGVVTIAVFVGGRYLGSTKIRAPAPKQTITYNLSVPAVHPGEVVSASIIDAHGDLVGVTTTRVETRTGETVAVEPSLRTMYFETSIEGRIIVSTFVGTRPASFYEDPVQLALVGLSVGGLAASSAVAVRLRRVERREKEREREEREKRRGEPKLFWSMIPPTKLRAGGHIQIFNQVTNSGDGPATGTFLNGIGPVELELTPTLKIGVIGPGETKALPFKVSCRRGVTKKEYPLTLTLTCAEEPPQSKMMPIFVDALKVGLLTDSHNAAYWAKRGMTAAPAEAVTSWLLANNFDYDILNEAEDIAALQRYNVMLSPSQYSLSDHDISSLKQYVAGGGGLVALGGVGVVDADAFLRGEAAYSGSKRVFDLFGYSDPTVVEIVRGLQGIRVADITHAITRGLSEAMISLPRQVGLAFSSPPSTSKMLADQRVMVEGKTGYLGVAAVTANEFGGGRVVHFNLDIAEHIHLVSQLLDKALLWAAHFE